MPAAPTRDFYAILAVTRDADDDALKKAYKKMAVKYHPDKHANKSDAERAAAEAKFKDVAEAFEVLSDKQKREIYDQFGESGLKQGGSSPPSGAGMGGGGIPGFAGGMPGGVHFSFGGGGGGAMDAARAEAIFRQFFGNSGATGDDPFASLLGGGMGGLGGGLGGLGGGFHGNGPKRRRASRTSSDTLPPGVAVRLAGLSNEALNGTAA